MAVYAFSSYAGQTIANFNPANDTLFIAASYGRATAFGLAQSGTSLLISNGMGQIVTLGGTSFATLRTTTLQWGDGSRFQVGGGVDGNQHTLVYFANGVVSGSGDNVIWGGTGTPADAPFDKQITLTATATGNNQVNSQGGDDVIFVAAGANGNNVLAGGPGHDSITVNGHGNNTIRGDLGGDTIVLGGDGDNIIWGGNSYFNPVDGADHITINGHGDNWINAEYGDDTIVINGRGANTVLGGEGNDIIILTNTASGNNEIFGEAGNDEIQVTFTDTVARQATLSGGAGADIFDISATGGAHSVTISDFAGNTDEVSLDFGITAKELTVERHVGGVTISGADGQSVLFAGYSGNFSGSGSAANLTVAGGGVLQTNWGGSAATLTATSGADYLIAGNSGDTLVAGAYAARLRGGAGNDVFRVDDQQFGAEIVGGDGVDRLELTTSGLLTSDALDNVYGLEVLKVTSGMAEIDFSQAFHTKNGGVGLTTLDLSATDNSVVVLGSNALTLYGSAEDDMVTLSGGGHHVDTGNGDDTVMLEGALAHDAVLKGGAGEDRLIVNCGVPTTLHLNGSQIDNFEEVLVAFDDVSITIGAGYAIDPMATDGVMTISKFSRDDTATLHVNGAASTHDLQLSGAAGDDVLIGGAGDDIFIISGGADVLTGGAGADYFIFDEETIGASGTITDFTIGTDGFGGFNAAQLTVAATSGGYADAAAALAAVATPWVVFNDTSGDVWLAGDWASDGFDAAEDVAIRLGGLTVHDLVDDMINFNPVDADVFFI